MSAQQKQTTNKNSKSDLQLALKSVKKIFVSLGIYSFFLNILMLAAPFYMLVVYDVVRQGVLATGNLLVKIRNLCLTPVPFPIDRELLHTERFGYPLDDPKRDARSVNGRDSSL